MKSTLQVITSLLYVACKGQVYGQKCNHTQRKVWGNSVFAFSSFYVFGGVDTLCYTQRPSPVVSQSQWFKPITTVLGLQPLYFRRTICTQERYCPVWKIWFNAVELWLYSQGLTGGQTWSMLLVVGNHGTRNRTMENACKDGHTFGMNSCNLLTYHWRLVANRSVCGQPMAPEPDADVMQIFIFHCLET